MKMGYAQTDITPAESIQTIGFGRADEWSRGVLAPLLAQASVWRSAGEICCLIAVDHIGFSRQHAAEVRKLAAETLGITSEKVMLCFSHCHSTPNDSATPSYYEMLREKIVACAARAKEDLCPVRFAWGNARSPIGVNRRADAEALDDRAGALLIEDARTGRAKALLLRLTVHCNVLKADNYLISPDLFGALRDVLGARCHCPVIATQGASGDVAPRYFCSHLNPPDAPDARFVRSDNALREAAEALTAKLAPLIDSLRPQEEARLQMYSRYLTLYSEVPEMARAEALAEEAKKYCGIDGTAWLAEIARLREGGVLRQPERLELQYFQIGNFCLAGVPNELMCAFALRASEALGDEYFYLGGYTNGCTGYFPTEEEFDRGGYEVYWSWLSFFQYHGHVFPFERDSASALIRFAVENRAG